MIKNRNTLVLHTEYQSTENLKKFMTLMCGLKLTPVRNQTDSYWISGDEGGTYIDGPKYYKIKFGAITETHYETQRNGSIYKNEKTGYGFDIQCSGDYNGFSLIAQYKDMIKTKHRKSIAEQAVRAA